MGTDLTAQWQAVFLSPRYPIPGHVVAFALLIAGYVGLGLLGLQLQSSHVGVTLVWPAAGLAFAAVYWLGYVHLLALAPAMLVLAALVGVPVEVAGLSAVGSMLEAGIPVLLMRRFDVDPRLAHLRDALLFVGFVALLGPVFSATTGGLAFYLLGADPVEFAKVWLLWWLGNSIGLLIVGGFGLVVVARRSWRVRGRVWMEVAVAGWVVAVITIVGMYQVAESAPPLVNYLLIPVFVLIAQRGDQYPVSVLAMTALSALLVAGSWLPHASLAPEEFGGLYLDVSLLWVVTFTGMLTSSARREMRAREEVSWLATHDPLTRLLNRHALMERLEEVLDRRKSQSDAAVLLVLDLDRFKELNDIEGHRVGDRVLRDISVILIEEIRSADTVARLGSDEFAVLLADCRLLDACSVAENIRSVIEGYEYHGDHGRHRVEASIGMVELATRHASPEDVLHDADHGCYEAKRAGRNRVWVFADDSPKPG